MGDDRAVEFGIYSFGERTQDPADGSLPSTQERLSDLLEEIALADEVGLDVFGLGEHHRPDYAVSAPAVVLAAAAARTRRIRLTTAVTVLSSDDPVRVFQAFATLDLLSAGRAEIMVGRGSFIESFPLFGYSLEDYEELFREKLDLLLAIRASERVTWQGRLRPPLEDALVSPRPLQDPLPVWIAVGGTPDSARRAGALGLPMLLAIIGGSPERFRPFAELHRREAERTGLPRPRFGIGVHGYIAPAGDHAARESFPYVAQTMNRVGRERGWRPMTLGDYELECGPDGAYFVGSPEAVAAKIVRMHEIFGLDRFLLQVSVGTMPHAKVMRAIELFGTEVVPAVRSAIG